MKPGLRVVVAACCVLIAVVLAILSWKSGGNGTSARQPRVPAPAATAFPTVVVAERSLQRGQPIAPKALALRRIEPPIPPAALTTITSAAGGLALRDIAAGQIVMRSDIEGTVVGSGLAALIPDGMRAVAIRVDAETAVGNFLAPDDRVDVKWIISKSGDRAAGARTEVRSLLDNVLVLAAGDTLAPAATGTARRMETVILAVTPDAAQKLAVAKETGQLYLALRQPRDDGAPVLAAVSTDNLRGTDDSPSPPAGEAPRHVTVISGVASNRLMVEEP